MQTFRCVIAKTELEIMDAQRVRHAVYVEEEGLLPASVGVGGREIDGLDYLDTTVHFLVYAGLEPVGTVRLLRGGPSSPAAAEGKRLGLDIESKLNLDSLAVPGVVTGEVTRFCVRRRYRRTGVTGALFAGLRDESARLGITHWVAGANMETDCVEDAVLAYRLAFEKNLINPRFSAEPRDRRFPRTPRRRPYYNEEQRRRGMDGELTGLELPRTLSLFAAGMGARFIGPPVFDAYFDIFALPLVAALADIPAQRARSTERRAPARLEAEARP
jgi:putative hemolysin